MDSVVERNIYMVEPVDFNKPVYNGVNISISKPEVNAGGTTNPMESNNDNGIYNAVRIGIDNPKVNTQPKKIYDYPQAESIVTYEMLNVNPIKVKPLPAEYAVAEEIPVDEEEQTVNKKTEESAQEIDLKKLAEPREVPRERLEALLTYDKEPQNTNSEDVKAVKVPAPNYTTLEAEKTYVSEPSDEEKNTEEVSSKLSFKAADNNLKKPEIVPSENILPKVDIALVDENLSGNDKDIQAQQMEEIVRTVIMDKENAKNYLVSDVFTNLIKITEEDVTKLAPPTKEQIEARKKLIANIMAVEKDRNAINNLPYKMSDEEVAKAADLSPLELAERNKEYAITALGALAELFIEDYEAKEGRVVPITDAPGVSAIVNALRKDPDPSVKLAAIDALRHIQRPEYKEELSALFSLAQADPNPNVARAAALSLQAINQA